MEIEVNHELNDKTYKQKRWLSWEAKESDSGSLNGLGLGRMIGVHNRTGQRKTQTIDTWGRWGTGGNNQAGDTWGEGKWAEARGEVHFKIKVTNRNLTVLLPRTSEAAGLVAGWVCVLVHPVYILSADVRLLTANDTADTWFSCPVSEKCHIIVFLN